MRALRRPILVLALLVVLTAALASSAQAATPSVRWQFGNAALEPGQRTNARLTVAPRGHVLSRLCVHAPAGVSLTARSHGAHRVRPAKTGGQSLCWTRRARAVRGAGHARHSTAALRPWTVALRISVAQAAAPDARALSVATYAVTRPLLSRPVAFAVLAATAQAAPSSLPPLGGGSVLWTMHCENNASMRTPCAGRRIAEATGSGATPGSLDSITTVANGFAVLSQSVGADGRWSVVLAYSCGTDTSARWPVTVADSGYEADFTASCNLAP